MRAAILAVGSELLGADRADTNSLLLAAAFRRHGVDLVRKTVVGDDPEAIGAEIERDLAGHELLVVSGGLGPTSDDLTREAVAGALGRALERVEELVEDIEAKFARYGFEMTRSNLRQADVVAGAEILWNPRGTAPGQRIDLEESTLFLVPGVPRELVGMIDDHIEPWLAERSAGRGVETGFLKAACIAESALEDRIAAYYEEFGRQGLSILPRPGEMTLQVSWAGSADERRREIDRRLDRLAELVGRPVFGRTADATLEATVGEALAGAGATVATAESCTGGQVAERLTRVAGSSGWFVGAVVAYSNRLKSELLGVPGALLEAHGAVSEPVARAMAIGARERLGADYALAITGIAGPGGGSEEKPVGTVHVALAGPGEPPDAAGHRRLQLPGDRERVRRMSSQWALEMLRRRLAAGPSREAV